MPNMSYDPNNWFWISVNGRLFSSARQSLVSPDDPGYLAFLESGRSPTPWPQDNAGAQTDAALADVLAPYGLAIGSDTKKRLLAHAKAKHVAVLSGGITVDISTNGEPAQIIEVATDLEGRINLDGAVSLSGLDPTHIFEWVQSTGVVSLAGDQVKRLGVAAAYFVQETFVVLGMLQAEIESGGITTTAEIESAPWPHRAR